MRPSAIAAGFCTMAVSLAAMQPPEARSVYALARRLMEAGVPVGMILPARVWQEGLDSRRATMALPSLRAEDVSQLLRRFSDANPALGVTRTSILVRVRSIDEPLAVRDTLNRLVPIAESSRLSAMDVVLRKVLPIVAGGEPGIVGTGLSPGRTCRVFEDIVQLEPGSPTIPELLDATVAQVPGLSWWITYDADAPDLDLEFGLLCSDGSSQAVTDLP